MLDEGGIFPPPLSSSRALDAARVKEGVGTMQCGHFLSYGSTFSPWNVDF